MKSNSAREILHELQCFRQMGSVLYIAAHPDDENTELLAYLSRGRGCRTAYLSLTRGDGGQNVLGSELGAKLGVARTQELLAARRLDGAQQFFSRAIDFGFSKSYGDTLSNWNKEEVLSDIVRVIRRFHPDVVITRFSPTPGGTHGHHTASAMLALEAFKLCGNADAFPEQKLACWQPKRIFWNISTFQKDKAVGITPLKIDIGGKDPVSRELFTDIASKSRAMHKTQGLGSFRVAGLTGGTRLESFQLLAGVPATADILDGIDTSWSRVAGGAEIGKDIDGVIERFNPEDVPASIPALLNLRTKLEALHRNNDPLIRDKRALLDRILQECLGLKVETTVARHEVVPGETLKLHHTAVIQTNFPVAWCALRYPGLKKEVGKAVDLRANEASSQDSVATLPASTALTQPWWLASEGTPGLFGAANPELIGDPENLPALAIEDVFEVAGQRLVIHDEPVQVTTDDSGNQLRRRLDVIPPVWLKFTSDVILLKPGTSRTVEIEVSSSRANSSGVLRLAPPPDWKVVPSGQPFYLREVGEHERLKFRLSAPARSESARITACAEMHGVRYCSRHEEVNYEHIAPQLLQPPATLKAVSLEFSTRGQSVGYLAGAGDSLPENLKEMGYSVKILNDETLSAEDLQGLDAVVTGVRAFNVRPKIAGAVPVLFDYIKNGGTVIVQYNRPDNLKADKIAPYDMHISADRVTNYKAPVTFLAPENPVLNTPNKISNGDFAGWVQEREIYCPDKWDDHFIPILAFNDAGEAPVKGGLLVAPYGKGCYIYTGLVFFRQLPAGVPGAYRLFANLVSINKEH